MVFRIVAAAVLAAVCAGSFANAQSAADIGDPRELPPASFKGQQYVDSRGCVFLRAGFGGQVNWVARVTRERKALCGYPPSFGAAPQIEVADEAPAPVAGPKAPAAKTATAKVAAPRVKVQVAGTAPVAAPIARDLKLGEYERVPSVAGTRKIGCYASAPVPVRVRMQDGGSTVWCTTGDGTMTNARLPRALQGDTVAHADAVAAPLVSTAAAIVVPPGYKLAWTDDRLNTRRAIGTRQGWADQEKVWTRTVPAELVEPAFTTQKGKRVIVVRRAVPGDVAVSTKSDPAAKAGLWVQVGTFGQQSNADGAAARLAGLGLPVAKSKINKGGKALQIVMAGPFASASDAQTAVSAARSAGFSDAFIR